MKVQNMKSPRTGKPVANQFLIIANNAEGIGRKEVFQSYDSTIAIKEYDDNWNKTITLDETYWDYSVTTGRYRNEFLGEGIDETRKKIASGEYKLAKLN